MKKRAGQRSGRRILRSLTVFAASAALCAALFLIVNPRESGDGLQALFLSGFSTQAGLRKTLLFWPLLLLSALSFGTAWKAGFVNLGLPGQFIVGAALALAGALLFALPWWVCLLAAAVTGAAWSLLSGILKTRFRVSEVLSGVMLNFLALYLAQWLWEDALSGRGEGGASSAMPGLLISEGVSVPAGLFLALGLCAAAWAAERFSVFGYEVKAGGSNPEAAARAGMPVQRNATITLALTGAFAGLAGGMCVLSGLTETTLAVVSGRMGFTGMAVSLLCFGHPLGMIPAAFLAAGLWTGGEALPSAFPGEAADLLAALTLLGASVLHGKRK